MANTATEAVNPYQTIRQWEKAFALAQVAACLEDPLQIAEESFDWGVAAKMAGVNPPGLDVRHMAIDMVMLTIGVHADDPRATAHIGGQG